MAEWLNNAMNSVSGSAGGIIGSAITSIANGISARAQRNWSSDEAEKNRDYQTEMWNKTNDYNTPAAQLQRMRDAGLNPLQGIAQAEAVSPTGAQASQYQRNQMENPMEMMFASSQIRKTNADAEHQEILNEVDKQTYGVKVATEIREALSRMGVNSEQANNLAQSTELLSKQTNLYDKEANARIKQALATSNLNTKQADVAIATMKKLQEEVKWLGPQASALIASQVAAAGKTEADIENLDWNSAKTVSYSAALSMGLDVKTALAGAGISGSGSESHSFLVMRDHKIGKFSIVGVDLLGNGEIKDVKDKRHDNSADTSHIDSGHNESSVNPLQNYRTFGRSVR